MRTNRQRRTDISWTKNLAGTLLAFGFATASASALANHTASHNPGECYSDSTTSVTELQMGLGEQVEQELVVNIPEGIKLRLRGDSGQGSPVS